MDVLFKPVMFVNNAICLATGAVFHLQVGVCG